jgi:AhpD family alkylhydroperoxidase
VGELQSLELSDATAIPNKYKELIGLAVSGATRCRYCPYFHSEAARLFGATEDEITETALIAKNTMGWSTYLNTLQFDYDASKAIRAPAISAPSSVSVSVMDTTFSRTGSICIEPGVARRPDCRAQVSASTRPTPARAAGRQRR